MEKVIDEAGDRFKKTSEVYSEELIYWIGYIYRYWHYVTGESSKEIIKLAPVKVMKKNCERLYNTFSGFTEFFGDFWSTIVLVRIIIDMLDLFFNSIFCLSGR